jgi:hypothetical protein
VGPTCPGRSRRNPPPFLPTPEGGGIRAAESGDADYADASYIPQHPSYEWQWSLGDVVNAVLQAGLRLELLNEYDRLFFKACPSMVELSERWYHLPQYAGKLPLLFTLRAKKPE